MEHTPTTLGTVQHNPASGSNNNLPANPTSTQSHNTSPSTDTTPNNNDNVPAQSNGNEEGSDADNKESTSQHTLKRRNRIPASCSMCRKRKSKCDRVRPVCGTCIRKGIAHLCQYEVNSSHRYIYQNSHPYQGQGYMQGQSDSYNNLNGPQPFPVQVQPQLPGPLPPHFAHHTPQHYVPPSPNSSDPANYVPHNNPQQFPGGGPPPPPPPPPHLYHSPPFNGPPLSQPSPDYMSPSAANRYSPSNGPPGLSLSYGAFQHPPSNNGAEKVLPRQLPIPAPSSHHRTSQDNGKPYLPSPTAISNSMFRGGPHHLQSGSISSIPLPPPPSAPIPGSAAASSLGSEGQPQLPPPSASLVTPKNASTSPLANFPTSQHPSPNEQNGVNQTVTPSARIRSMPSENVPSPLTSMHKPSATATTPGSYTSEQKPISMQNSPGAKDSFSSNNLVSIPLGPNSSLQVSTEDRMNVFSNSSYSIALENHIVQEHGVLSYLGLTKSDPFITILRNFTVHLFRAGEMTKFIRTDANKKRRNSTGSASKLSSKHSDGLPSFQKKPKLSMTPAEQDNAAEAAPMVPTDSSQSNNDVDINNLSKAAIKHAREQSLNALNVASPLDKYSPNVPENKRDERKIPKITPSVESFFTGLNKKEYYALVEKVILATLPDQVNLFKLFCRFFKYVHPFIPIIDETSFIVEVKNLLITFPSFGHERWTSVKIRNDQDLRTLGLFLLILSLGFKSLIQNDNVYNEYTDEEVSMIQDMTQISSDEFKRVINLCISDSLLGAKSSFKLVQLLTLLYFYKEVSADDDHGICGSDSQILLGVTIRHALAIGLNRDPTSYTAYEAICKNPSLIKTWRHLWNYLTQADAMSSLHNGTNLNLRNLKMSDVQAPYELKDKTGELNETIKRYNSICDCYRQLCNKINNVWEKPKVMDILADTNHLEKIFFDFFGKDFFLTIICKPAKVNPDASSWDASTLEHEEQIIKVMKYCMFIQLRTNLSGMYYMIAIHYENEYNESKTPSMNAGIELFKIYIKSVVQIVYIMTHVLDNSVELFGKNFDYILTAANERYMIRTHSFLTSFFIRLLHQKKDLSFKVFKEPSYIPRLEVIDTLFTMVLIEAELFVGNFRKMSRTYINSYRLYIMTYIIMRQCVENPDVFFEKAIHDQLFFHQGTNMIEFFTLAELHHLCRLCGEFRNATEEKKRLKREKLKAKGIIVENDADVDNFNFDSLQSSGALDDFAIFNDGNGTTFMSFFDDDQVFDNLNNLPDDILDPVARNEDLIRLYNIYGDFDEDLVRMASS